MNNRSTIYRRISLLILFILLVLLSACGGVPQDPVSEFDNQETDGELETMAHQELPGANLAGSAGFVIDAGHVDYVPEETVETQTSLAVYWIIAGVLILALISLGVLVWLRKSSSSTG